MRLLVAFIVLMFLVTAICILDLQNARDPIDYPYGGDE